MPVGPLVTTWYPGPNVDLTEKILVMSMLWFRTNVSEHAGDPTNVATQSAPSPILATCIRRNAPAFGVSLAPWRRLYRTRRM